MKTLLQRTTLSLLPATADAPAFHGAGIANYCPPRMFCDSRLLMIGDNGVTGLRLRSGASSAGR